MIAEVELSPAKSPMSVIIEEMLSNGTQENEVSFYDIRNDAQMDLIPKQINLHHYTDFYTIYFALTSGVDLPNGKKPLKEKNARKELERPKHEHPHWKFISGTRVYLNDKLVTQYFFGYRHELYVFILSPEKEEIKELSFCHPVIELRQLGLFGQTGM